MTQFLHDLFGLSGKVAIVTGASRGIGATIADALASAGATVIGVARSEKPDQAPVAGVTYQSCDIVDEAAFQQVCATTFENHKRLDILVNNAGIYVPIKTDEDNRIAAFDAMIKADLRACYTCAIAAADLMKQAGNGGAIVNITSIGGVRGFANMPGYAAAKGGLEQLSRALAMDLGPHDIRVNNIAPGYIITGMSRHTLTTDLPGRERRLRRLILKRHGDTWEVAAAALFLASRGGAYITGDTLHVDGGWAWQGMS
jgi:NAD(P)-dependent dehydrogenase (short-subunit alcohol dehydrogenase family)